MTRCNYLLNEIDAKRKVRTTIQNPQGYEMRYLNRDETKKEFNISKSDVEPFSKLSYKANNKVRTTIQNPQGSELRCLNRAEAKERFKNALLDIKEYSKLSMKTDIEESTRKNIFRSQVIMIVSSLDSFLHEMIKITILLMNNQQMKRTDVFFDIKNTVKDSSNNPQKLVDKAQSLFGGKSFYNYKEKGPKDVKEPVDGIQFCLFKIMGLDKNNIISESGIVPNSKQGKCAFECFRDRIREIANRRNSIAHNYDRNEFYNPTDIEKKYTDDIINDISNLVESILVEVNRNIVKIKKSA